MAAIPPATDPPNVLLGQTWDWVSATGELPLVLKVRQTGKPEVVSLVEAGQLGKIGMSTAGFGLCLTWLEADQRALGVPVHLLCRAMLNQNSIAEAVNLLLRVPRGAAAGFMFASGCGIALAVEATPTAIGVLEPENGLLVHTNHFLAPHLQASDRGLLCDGAGSLVRRQRALALLQPALGKIDSQTLERVQSDTECAPSSICRSGTVSPLEDNETLAGIIMDLSRMEMYVASGKPSENPYARIHS
jgi:isopenicillin-N N-acyltransferase-like protein